MADSFFKYNKKNCEFSVLYALINAGIVCMEKINADYIKTALMHIKQKYIYHYLSEEICAYNLDFARIDLEKHKNTESSPIFCCWLQGFDHMPAIARTCYLSIKEHANGHPVHFISEENLEQYIEVPFDMMKKYQRGVIGPAHFSDYIRMALLSKYGGLWLDVTVFVTQNIPEWYFQIPFYSIKYPNQGAKQISNCEWTGFVLGGGYQSTSKILSIYWKDIGKNMTLQ